MSTETFDRITAIASRQPAMNPARHHVSPAVLEFRLQQVTLERDQLAAQLRVGVELIDGPLVGAAWKQACRDFCGNARELLATINANPLAPIRSRP